MVLERKKGQVTVFIIVGIFLLAVIGIGLFFMSRSDSNKVSSDDGSYSTDDITLEGRVNGYVSSCLKKELNDAVFENAYFGGYFILPKNSTIGMNEDVPYYFINGVNLTPTDEVLAKEIADYIDTLLYLCLDFTSFEDEGYNMSVGDSKSSVLLSSSQIKIKTDIPIGLSKDGSVSKFSKFSSQIQSDKFYTDMVLVREVAEFGKEESICASCIAKRASENNVKINILPFYNNTYVFELTDSNLTLVERNFKVRFATKYETE